MPPAEEGALSCIPDSGATVGGGRAQGRGLQVRMTCLWILDPATLAAHTVKNPPAVRETWIRSLG